MIYIKPEILQKVNQWLTPTFDEGTQQEIKELIAYNPKELEESFYKTIEFGTGGMRGIMGPGDNRINKYTLGKNTQGISNYLRKQFPGEQLKAVIAYDCRKNSKELAKVVADVFSANGVDVYLFTELRPTPLLSYAVKYLECHCGIVLTASHNPPEYNGYKVYWQDGGQLVPPQDADIISEINNLKYEDIQFIANEKRIIPIDTEVDNAFLKDSVKNADFNISAEAKQNLKIVFTSLHGTAITLNPKALENAGYTNFYIVEEQAEPDGQFPTVKSPNPEEPEALEMALQLAEKVQADIVIGTDPDGDRLGIAVRDTTGKMVLLSGNEAMLLMTDYLLDHHKRNNTLQENAFIASTIVSTPMMEKLAAHYNVECKVGLTGFKWIAKMIKDNPQQQFIGGGEESFGYMVGDFVRDKDAVTATLLACAIAARAKEENSTMYRKLLNLYTNHGFYKEQLVSLTKKGIAGAEEIEQMMLTMRGTPLKNIGGSKVISIDDYSTGKRENITTGTFKDLNIPNSNVLIYTTEDGTRVAARPSGTEPKIKFYISTNLPLENESKFEKVAAELDAKILIIKKDLGI